jgi:hypothetical protein
LLDLAKWRPGDIAYAVTHHVPPEPVVDEASEWMVDGTAHPQIGYQRGLIVSRLGPQTPLPKMHALEFDLIMGLLHSRLVVSEFKVVSVERCPYTGECLYTNIDDARTTSDPDSKVWQTCGSGSVMPESCLFATRAEAVAERDRIMDLFRRWACDEPPY